MTSESHWKVPPFSIHHFGSRRWCSDHAELYTTMTAQNHTGNWPRSRFIILEVKNGVMIMPSATPP